MARRPALPLLLLLAAVAALAAASAAAGAVEMGALAWELGVVGASEDDELGLPAAGAGEDHVARRVLQGTNGYISYGALRRDNTPCSVRGASYYNCRPGANANPYSRGCSAITRCRG